MICPACKSNDCRRSRRRGVSDRVLRAAGMLPWKCRSCEHRFHAWRVPPAFLLKAHCPKCGNLEIERVARKRVEGGFLVLLQRALQLPAYRCDPCRHKFFAVRPLSQVPAAKDAAHSGAAEVSGEPHSAGKAPHSA